MRILSASIAFATFFFFGFALAEVPQFDGDRAFSLLEKQCSFGPRNPGSDGHKKCGEWLAEALRERGGEVYLQKFKAMNALENREEALTNIIARFDGGSGSTLMLCAHWDTRPVADRDPNPENRKQPIIGANDGASGVAVLLELATIFQNDPPPRPVLIVFFDGEDMGRGGYGEEYALGSRYWAEHQLPEPPVEAILLDMVGDADLEFKIEQYSEISAPRLRREIWSIASNLACDAFVERIGPAVEDDHLPLIRAGIPAIDIIDFDYPYWHTIQDTPDKCSAESLSQTGRVLVEYIYR